MLNIVLIPFKSLFFDKTISRDVLIFSIFLILIPIALITGPAIPDIFLSLIAFYFLFISLYKRLWSYYSNPIVYGFLLFSLYGILRSLFSEMPLESLANGGSVFYFRYIFFAMGVWYLLDINPYLSKCLLNILVLCILLICIDSIYQYYFNFNIFGNNKHTDLRLTSVFGDEPIVGRYISYLSMFTFVLIYQSYKKTKLVMIFSFILLIISEVTVFLSGERSPLFYLVFFSILIIFFIPKLSLFRLISLSISIIIIFSALSIKPNAKMRIVDLTSKQTSKTHFPFLPYSDHHEEHYVSALKMFVDKPIFGVGTNLFRYECKKPEYNYKTRSCSTHPHNYFIQSMAELGLIGFLFLSTFFIYLLIIIIRQLDIFKFSLKKQIPLEFFLYSLIVFLYWWPIIPHMSLYNNWNNVLMMLPLGFFMRYLYKK